ncbi:ribosomal RNA small subunit methyltransferase I [Iodidimonas gelatinilytica]|uniref:Ribosomal RNA small subunit methyltransferase I n=1 Tax=Iodidimonas gelatinilytica TaxID=1236966 RepID=A0A5A7N043_9PROT|nr:16S rRNA (cytidine(1402)-2'-O)-methyltransferase [Iodidimonas gelatinilytica]GER01623.1 ribosomal RNA small subunit methyltransferase I [Iodidimonas gelatinilytica]
MARFIEDSTDAPVSPGLYIVATPIGNLGDISHRALEILSSVDLIACEDTRVSLKLLTHYGIKKPLLSYHDHNARSAGPKILSALAKGQAVALISDAGTPLISDPGYRLVADARAEGHRVIPIPGACAFVAAVSASGLPTDKVMFLGFSPPKSVARKQFVTPYQRLEATLVLYESPNRLVAALTDFADILGDRQAAICRELTKRYEDIRRGSLLELAQDYAGQEGRIKGEIAIIIAPAETTKIETGDLDPLLRKALKDLSVREAAAAVSWMTGEKRRTVYQKALAIKAEMEDGTS